MEDANAIALAEAELALLFEQAGLAELPVSDAERVNKVIERSLHEKAIKDTASFVFIGFPAAMIGFLAIAANSVGQKDIDYRA